MKNTLSRFGFSALIATLIFSLIVPPALVPAFADDSDEVSSTAPEQNPADTLLQAFTDGSQAPLDIFRLLQQTAHPTDSVASLGTNLTLKIVAPNGSVTKRYSRGSRNANADLAVDPGSTFEVWHQDTLLYTFTMPVRAVGFYGSHLVFLDNESFLPSTGVHNLYYIDFSSFRSLVGRERVPIFRLPVRTDDPSSKLCADGRGLIFGREQITTSTFEPFTHVQQMGLALASNLSDPKVVEESAPFLAEFQLALERMLTVIGEDQAVQADGLLAMRQRVQPLVSELVQQVPAYAAVGQNKTLKKVRGELATLEAESTGPSPEHTAKKAELLAKMGPQGEEALTFASIAKTQAAQKRLLARLYVLWGNLAIPRPNSTPRLVEAMAQIAGGLSGATEGGLREGTLQLLHHRFIKYGVPVAAAATFGALYPEIAAGYVAQGVELVRVVLNQALGATRNAAEVVVSATTQTASGFSPYQVYETYLTPGNAHRTAVGLTALTTTLFAALGLPHLIMNSIRLYGDLTSEIGLRQAVLGIKLPPATAENPRQGFFSRLWTYCRQFRPSRFIERQNRVQSDYLQTLADSAAQKLGQDAATEFTAEEDARVRALIAELEEKNRSWFGRAFACVAQMPLLRRFLSAPSSAVREQRMTSFMGALAHLCASAASFTISGTAYVSVWNAWFAFRSFVWHPKVWAMAVYYPNYFPRLMAKERGVNTPSVVNGGLRPIWQEVPSRALALFGLGQLEALQAWEERILPIDAALEQEVLRHSSLAVLRLLDSPELIHRFVQTNGIDRVGDPTLAELSWPLRKFFRLYQLKLQERTWQQFLTRIAGTAGIDVPSTDALVGQLADPPSERSVTELKQALLTHLDQLALSPGEAGALVAAALAEGDLFAEVSAEIDSGRFSLTALRDSLNFASLRFLDPARNRQVARLQAVNRQVQNVRAMARAVRATMTAFLVDKPMELALLFVCLAGVNEGLMKPLHEEMFGPNSTFFFGTYAFYTGFITSTVMSAFADIWLKLQADEQNEGHFENRPGPEDAGGSFTSWFRKQFSRSDKNTWWQNQVHMSKLIAANIPAALVTYLTTNLLTLGRLDLDAYLVGYMITFSPLLGLNTKLEQTFEMASGGWYAREIPVEYETHPEAQRYINSEIGRARVRFNLVYKAWENISGNFLGVLTTIRHATVGPRALTRLIFAGYTPTEWAFWASESAAKLVDFVPGAGKAIRACREILIHGYQDSILPDFPDYGPKPPAGPPAAN